MRVLVAEHSGTCFGVDNAIKKAFDAAANTSGLKIRGELVHNPQIVDKLSDSGVMQIADINELKEGDSLIIRAHGERKGVYKYCSENRINIIDATCPFVRKAQDIASRLSREGYQVAIVGNPDHPEVKSIKDHAEGAIIISGKVPELRGNVAVIAQTTQHKEVFDKVVEELARKCKIQAHDTICNATKNRQDAAIKLCKAVEVMIVIGGRNSSNTEKLYNICKERVKTYWVAFPYELRSEWFDDVDVVGVTGGASTPKDVIDKVVSVIQNENL